MPWLQTHITTPKSGAAFAEALLESLGALSVTLTDAGDEPQLELSPGEEKLWSETVVTGLFPADVDQQRLVEALQQAAEKRQIPMQVACERAADLCERVGSSAGGAMSVAVHPSQLYEAALEGLLLFVVLWLFSSRQRPRMAVSGMFLLGYGLLRFGVEFVRMPDAHIGYLAGGWLTTGMLLTAPMILFGLLLLALAYGNRGKRHEAVS
jgi:prolipoprotein diacylglyceryltransferase